jgi:hypothetical protein
LRILGNIFGQEFQRDESAQLGVLRLVHHAHAAATEFFNNPVLAEGFADHGWILRWNLIRWRYAESKKWCFNRWIYWERAGGYSPRIREKLVAARTACIAALICSGDSVCTSRKN